MISLSTRGVLFLNTKDETPKLIIDHIKKIELEANLVVRKIRSDNGTEFKNAILNEFCIEKGISRQYSASRTPQPEWSSRKKEHDFSGSSQNNVE